MIHLIDGMNIEHIFGDRTSVWHADWIATILNEDEDQIIKVPATADKPPIVANLTIQEAMKFRREIIGHMFRPWNGSKAQFKQFYYFKTRSRDRKLSTIGYIVVGPYVKYWIGNRIIRFTTENIPNPRICQRYLDLLCLWEYCFVLSQEIPYLSYTCPLSGYKCVRDKSICNVKTDKSSNKRSIDERRRHIFECHLGKVYLCLDNRCPQKYYQRQDLANHYITHHKLKRETARYIVDNEQWQNFYDQRWRGVMGIGSTNINNLIKNNRRNIYGTIPFFDQLHSWREFGVEGTPRKPSKTIHFRNRNYLRPTPSKKPRRVVENCQNEDSFKFLDELQETSNVGIDFFKDFLNTIPQDERYKYINIAETVEARK